MRRRFEKRGKGRKVFNKTANRTNTKGLKVSRGGIRF